MWPRLALLRELLADDGLIFVSIDDNEGHHLRCQMNELFGDDVFVGTITWEKRTKAQNTETAKAMFQSKTEYVLVYCRTPGKMRFNLETNGEIAYDKEDSKGVYRLKKIEEMSASGIRGRKTMVYAIMGVSPRRGFQWKVGEETIKKFEERGDILLEGGRPYMKMRPNDEAGEKHVPFWSHFFSKDIYGTAETAKAELTEIMGSTDHGFETVKPVKLIEKILFHATEEGGNDLVLDAFAGSGTTAQAVLAANKKDGGSRKFILVEPEDYAYSLTSGRVRRVIKGVPKASDEDLRQGLGGSFTYCELGQELNVETLLKADKLPDYPTLARYVFYTATGQTLERVAKAGKDFYIGETDMYRVHLAYKPEREFLRSGASALNSDLVERIAAGNKSKKGALVFATAKFMGQRELSEKRIEFAQLPYAIYRVLGD